MLGVANYTNFAVAGSPSWVLGQTPNWRGGAFDGWRHVKSVFAQDFRRNQAMCNESDVVAGVCIDVSRDSTRTLDGGDGSFRNFAVNEPALIDGKGLFVGGEFTNKIRNPRGEGGVVGTVGVTNKCMGYNAAPPAPVPMGTAAAFNSAVTNMTASGGDVSTLFGVVDDTAALQAAATSDPVIQAGLDNGWLNGRVYKLDNSAGASNAFVTVNGATGNTNTHFPSFYYRSVGEISMRLGASAFGSSISSSVYTRYKPGGYAPASSATMMGWLVKPGSTGYFILFDLAEASTYVPVPTVVAGASAAGALPTYWNCYLGGLSVSFLGTGMAYGLSFADVRIAGMAAGSTQFGFETSGRIPVAPGQAWGMDLHTEVLSGIAPSCYLNAKYRNSGSGYVSDRALSSTFTPTSARTLFSGKAVIYDTAAAMVEPMLILNTQNGTTYDFTLRIYAPKLCQLSVVGGGYLPNFPILPQVGSIEESVCAADIVMATAPAWLAGLDPSAGMSELVVVNLSRNADAVVRPLFEVSDGTEANSIKAYINSDNCPTLQIVSDGVLQTVVILPIPVATGLSLFAFVWSADGGYIVDQSGHVETFGAVMLPASLCCQQLGGDSGGDYLNDVLVQMQTCAFLSLDEVGLWMEHETI